MSNFRVFDADGHVNENESELREYLEAPYDSYLLQGSPDARGWTSVGISIAVTRVFDASLGGKLGRSGPPGWPAAQDWLALLDEGGMTQTVLFPSALLGYDAIFDPDYVNVLCRAYNNYVADKFIKFDGRLNAVAVLPTCDIDEAVKEMRRAVGELGCIGVMLGLSEGLGAGKFDPIYAQARRLDVPICIHGGARDFMKFNKFIQRHTAGFPISLMLQLIHMTYEGTFERFPDVRFGFLEGGATWVPYIANRMDEEWEKLGEVQAPGCRKRPSRYLTAGNIYFHVESSEDLIPEAIRYLGEGSLMYASDLPHWDSEYPDSIEQLAGRSDLSDARKQAILHDNAARFYALA